MSRANHIISTVTPFQHASRRVEPNYDNSHFSSPPSKKKHPPDCSWGCRLPARVTHGDFRLSLGVTSTLWARGVRTDSIRKTGAAYPWLIHHPLTQLASSFTRGHSSRLKLYFPLQTFTHPNHQINPQVIAFVFTMTQHPRTQNGESKFLGY